MKHEDDIRLIDLAMAHIAAEGRDEAFSLGGIQSERRKAFGWYWDELNKAMAGSVASAKKRQAERKKAGKLFAAVTLTTLSGMTIHKKQDYRCALTGMPFWLGNAGESWGPRCPSLDRIDVDGDYSVENVRVVLLGVNSLRGRSSDSSMLQIAQRLLEHAEYGGDGVIRLKDRSAGGRSR
jgi:hypothetical protein